MLIRFFMRFENIAIIFSLLLIFMVACSSMKQIDTANSCILFDNKKSWYKSTKKSYDRWGVPIALQLSIIKQILFLVQFL